MSSEESFDLFERMSHTESGRHLIAEFEKLMVAREGGYERSQTWLCEDGWLIEYTTTPMVGGPDDGKFVVLAFKPVGKGSRGGADTATSWQRTYMRAFAKRKTARARAETLFYRHSPERAARHGRA